jgi:hypothetical protein
MKYGNSQQRTTVILYLATAMLAIPAMLSAFIPLWIALLSGPLLFLVALSITKRKITERNEKI